MAPRLLTFCRSTRRCRCPARRTSRTGWYTDSRRSSCEPGTAHHPAAGDRQTAPRSPPVSKFPAGNTGRVYYSPSKDETRAGRRQNCAGTQAEEPLQAVAAAPSSSRPQSAAKTSETEPAGKRSPRGTNRSALHPMYKSGLVRFCLSARSMKQGRCARSTTPEVFPSRRLLPKHKRAPHSSAPVASHLGSTEDLDANMGYPFFWPGAPSTAHIDGHGRIGVRL